MLNITLSNGVSIPGMAIGTNWMKKDELTKILISAFEAGFRAIDTARDYGNEAVVGLALADAMKSVGLSREDVVVTTKIGNYQQINGNIPAEIDSSLKNLGLDYIDVLLMHWPYPGYYHQTWQQMEEVYLNSDKLRAIGVANYDVRHLKSLLDVNPQVIPMIDQVEFHPLRTILPLRAFLSVNNIALEAYAPLCRLLPPLRQSEILNDIAAKHGKSIGQIILRWHIQHGSIPVFKTYNPNRFKENIKIFDFSLNPEEMECIDSLNQDYKYHLESASCPGY